MANTKSPGVLGVEDFDMIFPESTPGTLGIHDRADPDQRTHRGDTPGSVGFNDASAVLAAAAPLSPQAAIQSAAAAGRRTLTPVQYADRYHNLRVPYLDPQSGLARSIGVDIHIYSNNGLLSRRSNMREKNRLVRLVRSELSRAGGLALIDVQRGHVIQIAHTFYAKGTPQECSVTLTHALRYGVATPLGVQHYCDRLAKIGLDCSGFVNNFFLEIGRISESRHISSYARGTQRSSFDEIQALDVLVWRESEGSASSHIAVVDHVIRNSNRMVVVESAGSKEGLVASEYTVLDVNRQVFHVDRGRNARGRSSTSHVIICEV